MGHDQGDAGVWEEDPSLAPDLKQTVTIDPAPKRRRARRGCRQRQHRRHGHAHARRARRRHSIATSKSATPWAAATAASTPTRSSPTRPLTPRWAWARAATSPSSTTSLRLDLGGRRPQHARMPADGLGHRRRRPRQGAAHPEHGRLQEFRRAQIQLQRRAIQNPRLRLVEHQGPHRRLVHQPDHRIPQRRRVQAGTGLPFRRQRQPRPDHPRLLARHPLRRRRGCNIPAGENWSKVIGPIFVYCNALVRSQDALRRPTWTRWPPPPAIPPCRPPGQDNATALWQDALAQAKAEKAKWPYDWVNGVDYPHKDERGTVTGQLVLNDPQAATTKLPHLTVGLRPSRTHAPATRGGGFATSAVRATATVVARWDARREVLPVLDRRHRGRQIHDHQRPPRHLYAARLRRRRARRIRAGQHHRRSRQNARPGQNRMEARALRQAGLGDRLPRPHRRQILQRRRRQLLALGLVRCATPICSPTTSPTPSARATTTRTGSSSRCRTRYPTPG